MRYIKRKNNKHILSFYKIELNRLILRSFIRNLNLPVELRNYAILALSKKHGHITRIRSTCFISSRSRSVNNFVKLTRHQLNFAMSKSVLTGFRKGVF